MKDMTTAEFQKANLAALEEPVKVRRYTKTVGTYYPEGYIASVEGIAAPALPGMAPGLLEEDLVAAQKVIEQKDEEIARLKRELAARPSPASVLDAGVRVEHPMKDVFAGLAKQDREFFERKLGKAKK